MDRNIATAARDGSRAVNKGQAANKGTVFNIQPFSIQDGPGIRTTVFLKGCPLHCPWCSNPESISPLPQIRTAFERCTGCGACLDACPAGALSLNRGRAVFDQTKCRRCFQCIPACSQGCISRIGQTLSVEDTVGLLVRDKIFFDHTGGGVTISGGEPLYQPDYLSAILGRLHGEGIHTTLDTTGHAPWNVFERTIENVDLLLYDIKHLDSIKHRSAVGAGNETILENLKKCSGRTEIWLRTPLVPGFNDDRRFMDSFVELALSVKAARCYFLPLHRWGGHKYTAIGSKNPYAGCRDWAEGEIDDMRKRYRRREGFVYFEHA